MTKIANKLSTLTGKHTKTDFCICADIDFLEMQIKIPKGFPAQKKASFYKLKQSDAMKAMKIHNLDTKLQEVLRTQTKKAENKHEISNVKNAQTKKISAQAKAFK